MMSHPFSRMYSKLAVILFELFPTCFKRLIGAVLPMRMSFPSETVRERWIARRAS